MNIRRRVLPVFLIFTITFLSCFVTVNASSDSFFILSGRSDGEGSDLPFLDPPDIDIKYNPDDYESSEIDTFPLKPPNLDREFPRTLEQYLYKSYLLGLEPHPSKLTLRPHPDYPFDITNLRDVVNQGSKMSFLNSEDKANLNSLKDNPITDTLKYSYVVLGDFDWAYRIHLGNKKFFNPKYYVYYTDSPAVLDVKNKTFSLKGNYCLVGFNSYNGITNGNGIIQAYESKITYCDGVAPFGNNYYNSLSSYFLDTNGKIITNLNWIDSNGNFPLHPSDEAKKYRLQTSLERFTDYTPERYPTADVLNKFNDWYLRPDVAYDDENVYKKGTPNSYSGFYFKPITNSPNPAATSANLLGYQYYTYHISSWTGVSWRRFSVWSTTLLKYNSPKSTEPYFHPYLSFQKGSHAIIVDYDNKGEHSMRAVKVAEENLMIYNSYYFVNDDIAVAKDKGTGNMGSPVLKSDGAVYDDGGNILDHVTSPDGSTNVPTPPDATAPYEDWFQWFIDSFTSLFDTMENGFKNITTSCSGFFSFLGSTFSFIPSSFWSLIITGVVILILLRIFGR